MKNKNHQIGALVLLALITFSACKKDFTCTCKVYDRGTGKYKRSYTRTGKYTNEQAQKWCSDVYRNAEWTQCALK